MKINNEWKLDNGKYKCPFCNKEYLKYGISTHIWRNHESGINHEANKSLKDGTRIIWNKGLNKNDKRIKNYSIKISKKLKGKKFILKNISKEEFGKKISESLKIAYKEHRAFGWTVHNKRKRSYPEKFFMKVIENEFNDKNYISELQISRYSIDFAWKDKKLAIEIDGNQHEFPDRKFADNKKDEYLISLGWKILRIKWKNMFHEPKKYIQIAKNFIEN